VIYRTSEIRRQIEKEIDQRYDELKEAISKNEGKIDLLTQKVNNEDLYLNQRLTNLHTASRSMILDLQHQFNEIVGYLEKTFPDQKFIIRTRILDKSTFNGSDDQDQSWTQIKKT
jgi:hypothetical protein